MPIGNPLLATCDETGVVRVYEYAGGVFSQIASRGGFTHLVSNPQNGNLKTPHMHWIGADDRLFVSYTPDIGSPYLAAMTPVLEDFQLGAPGSGGFARGEQHVSDFGRNAIIAHTNNGQNVTESVTVIRHEGGVLTYSNTAAPLPFRDVLLRKTSPDMNYTLVRNFVGTYLYDLTSSPSAKPLTFAALGATAFDVAADLAEWSYNNRCLLVGDTTIDRVQNWRYQDGAWSLMHEVGLPVGGLQDIAMSPDNRFCAISTLDGSTYRTRVYTRAGDYFQPYSDHTGIGEMITFSEDGKLLLDSRRRTCLRLVGADWQNHDSAMVNLAVSIYSQAISYGRTDPFATARTYPYTLGDLVEGIVDLNDLKFTLLTSIGTYDPTDTSVTDLSAEVTTGRWPAGGLPMTGVVGTETDTGYSIAADDLTRIVFESVLTARYGLIYEAATGKPLVHIDLLQDRTIARNRAVTFEFRDGEFLKFST